MTKAQNTCHYFSKCHFLVDIKEPYNPSGLVDDWKFITRLKSVASYYPYGKEIASANTSIGTYKFGFNGMEKEDHQVDKSQFLNFGARIYNSDIGIFLSQEPLRNEFPWQSPYVFAGNNPIAFIDELGQSKRPGRNIRNRGRNPNSPNFRPQPFTATRNINLFNNNPKRGLSSTQPSLETPPWALNPWRPDPTIINPYLPK